MCPANTINQRVKFIFKAGRFRLLLGKRTLLMGVLNLTPDSFSGDGALKKKKDPHRNLSIVQKMIDEGADIIDIGGESTRPDSKRISEEEEIKRVIPTLKLLSKRIKKPISIDTYKPAVAKYALDCGASIINNIMGTCPDKLLLKIIESYRAGIVLMHIRGTPETMQKNIYYKNLLGEIRNELNESVEKCLEVGIKSDRIIIDPGIGFGKTVSHNLEIIRKLSYFKFLNKPILVGTSRKSFIGKILDRDISERLMGTAATVCACILNGAHIVRVHDIGKLSDVVRMADALMPSNNNHAISTN